MRGFTPLASWRSTALAPFVAYTGHVFPEALAALGAHAAIFGTLPPNQGLANAPIFIELIFGELSNARETIWQTMKIEPNSRSLGRFATRHDPVLGM